MIDTPDQRKLNAELDAKLEAILVEYSAVENGFSAIERWSIDQHNKIKRDAWVHQGLNLFLALLFQSWLYIADPTLRVLGLGIVAYLFLGVANLLTYIIRN